MKKFIIVFLISLFFLSCDVSFSTKMGFYEIGIDPDTRLYCNTYITLINGSGKDFLGGSNKNINVYTFFFDDDENLLACRQDTLTPDDMLSYNVEEIVGKPAEMVQGVVKSIAFDPTSEQIALLMGYQTKKYYRDDELISISESNLTTSVDKIDPTKVRETCASNY